MRINLKKITIVAAAMIMTGNAMADQLTVQEAMNRARSQRHLAPSRNGVVTNYQLTYTAATGENNCYYVISDKNNGGFTVLSADDCAPAVLAQFDNAEFNLSTMPAQMRGMLNHYQNVINTAIKTGKTLRKVTPEGAKDIDIMCRTTWQQAAPYNNDCTELLNNNQVTAEEKSLTGCVATAMAQCLYYFYDKFGHEAQPTGSVEYTIAYKNDKQTAGCTAGDLPVSKTFGDDDKIDWENMILMYDGYDYTETQGAAVAKLMHMAGLSLKMQYEDKTGGSGTADENIPTAFKNNWSFDENVKYVERTPSEEEKKKYDDQEWTNLIFNELNAARPVMYGAVGRKADGTSGGGHEFVIDGYRTSDDLFHVNWGWENGYCNGWCYLANDDIMQVLLPKSETAGSTGTADSSNDPYANGQGAIIGIMPNGFAEMTACDPKGKNGAKKFVLTEDTDYTGTTELESANVTYKRTFTGNWQALYVPFAIPSESLSEFEVAEPSSVENGYVILNTVTATEANGIYFIKANAEGEKEIKVTGAAVKAAENATKEVGGVTFTGTSKGIKGASWDATWYAMGKGDAAGTLVKTNATPSENQDVEFLKPHRWYMTAPAAAGANLRLVVADEEATGIVNVNDAAASNVAYNLNGQRVASTTKGIVVVNGKKVFNK